MKKNSKIISILALLVLLLLAWAPWMDDQAVHGKVLQEKAHKYGTIGWAIQPDGTIEYTLICDYKLIGFPFWILVASCEGAYYVTFWGQILP